MLTGKVFQQIFFRTTQRASRACLSIFAIDQNRRSVNLELQVLQLVQLVGIGQCQGWTRNWSSRSSLLQNLFRCLEAWWITLWGFSKVIRSKKQILPFKTSIIGISCTGLRFSSSKLFPSFSLSTFWIKIQARRNSRTSSIFSVVCANGLIRTTKKYDQGLMFFLDWEHQQPVRGQRLEKREIFRLCCWQMGFWWWIQFICTKQRGHMIILTTVQSSAMVISWRGHTEKVEKVPWQVGVRWKVLLVVDQNTFRIQWL